ncbi:lytic transglycosylase catalytic subunit [Alcanivorax sp. S71-1-4]|uniref:transglycosylase SLT domain-containing protein n=1 Tax=Alcanivorax sp. S71-1-4 TaxID=1177159 RepID=UPI00135BAF88|nr:transglycosylase SLT domain-containing protein [Alcanivorax sp. S71-1-4]KAF0809927.1 lytic transglycosylase catalytic subunit [Alcanivorax sp. S71-1-4]
MAVVFRHPVLLLRTALLCAIALTPVTLPAAPATPVSHVGVARFQDALAAARDGDFERLAQLEKRLGNDYLMQGYLDYHRVRSGLPQIDAARVKDYMRQYRDLPLANSMERLAIARYGAAGNWKALRALRDTPPITPELACYYWQAVGEQHPQEAMDAVPAMWLTGGSRPAACDPLFDKALATGVIDDDLIWQRMLLAFRQGNPGLMRYLTGRLSDEHAAKGQLLRQLYNRPDMILSLDKDLPAAQRDALISAGLHRMAHTDTPAALAAVHTLSQRPGGLDSDIRAEAERRIAWYSIIRDLPENRAWADRWLRDNGDEELLEQRARRAVIEQQWPAVISWIARLPVADQQSARWQYWLGRAHQAMGDADLADIAYREAAAHRSFWGFTAADQLGQPYALNQVPPPAGDPLTDDAALQRVALLLATDEPHLARDEWLTLLRRQPETQMPALADYALAQGWPALAVDTAIHARAHNVLVWRFPRAYRDQFVNAAREGDIDPYLLMAVARRESAFHSHATSPVGARGLMQVMPGTARHVAKWLDEPAPDTDDLYDPLMSIRLGSTYLSDLLKRYQGNRLLALAAYNAGPQRVDEWLSATTLPFDVWVESIPYYETREYVQAVLAYRVLLEQLDRPEAQRRVALINASERHPGYHIALLQE